LVDLYYKPLLWFMIMIIGLLPMHVIISKLLKMVILIWLFELQYSTVGVKLQLQKAYWRGLSKRWWFLQVDICWRLTCQFRSGGHVSNWWIPVSQLINKAMRKELKWEVSYIIICVIKLEFKFNSATEVSWLLDLILATKQYEYRI